MGAAGDQNGPNEHEGHTDAVQGETALIESIEHIQLSTENKKCDARLTSLPHINTICFLQQM